MTQTTKSSSLLPPPLPVADSCTVIIFGATGDLSRRKLMAALYNLACAGCTGTNFQILGLGRTELSEEEFRTQLHDAVAKAGDTRNFTEETWKDFAARLHYLAGDYTTTRAFQKLGARLEELVAAGASPNRLFYYSTPPALFQPLTQGLHEAGLDDEQRGWSRLVVEKPFGRDLASARALNETLTAAFAEDQIYRIDHYLGKDTVQNILLFRFSNTLFEPVWNRHYIDRVEITATETLGVEGRGNFYEKTGALRDMVANHLLQLLALTAMEPPTAFDAAAMCAAKVRVLHAIEPMTPAEVAQRTIRGQYGAGEVDGKKVPGYRAEQDVAPDSTTETFADVEFQIKNERWSGVPFYLRTGKRLRQKLTEVIVHFKRTPHALFARTPTDCLEPNKIILRVQPHEGIRISFGAKRPGFELHAGCAQLDFDYQESFGVASPAAYESLLLDVMQGDGTLFLHRDEVEAQWRLITPIEEAWAGQPPPSFPNYAAGSDGPILDFRLFVRKEG